MRVRELGVVLGLAWSAADAHAQSVSSTTSSTVSRPAATSRTQPWLDAGSAAVAQPAGTTRLLAAIGGGVWHARQRLTLIGDGIMTLGRDSSGAGQLNARASYTPWRWLRTDVDASRLFASGNTSARMLAGRTTWAVGPLSLEVQGGQSRAQRGRDRFFGNTVSVGATTTVGPFSLRAFAERAHTSDYVLMEASGFTLTRRAASYALDDIGAEAAWRSARWSLAASQRRRRSRAATAGAADAFAVSATHALSPSFTLVAQGGTQLADVLRGVPQANYAGVSVRWSPAISRASRATPHAIAAPTSAPTHAPDGTSVTRTGEIVLQRQPGSATLQLTIDADADAVVEVACSADDWTPVRLAHTSAGFVHRLTLPSGAHKVAVRVNGGAWRAPRGLAAVSDEFGGSAGVVIVP